MQPLSALLIDTNIWLDYFIPQRQGHKKACHLIEEACRQDVTILYAVTSLKDVFYLVAVSLKRAARQRGGDISEGDARAIQAASWGIVEAMGELGTPIAADATDFWLARKYRALHADLEDNFVLAAARRAHVDVLVTGDEKLIKHAPVCAMTAEDACAYLEMGAGADVSTTK